MAWVCSLRQASLHVAPVSMSAPCIPPPCLCRSHSLSCLRIDSHARIGCIGALLPNTSLCIATFVAGSELLRRSLGACKADPAILFAELHVQSSNLKAVAFYQRSSFEPVETVPGYYRQLADPEAMLLKRQLQSSTDAEAGTAFSRVEAHAHLCAVFTYLWWSVGHMIWMCS
jgi:hypothetical protein